MFDCLTQQRFGVTIPSLRVYCTVTMALCFEGPGPWLVRGISPHRATLAVAFPTFKQGCPPVRNPGTVSTPLYCLCCPALPDPVPRGVCEAEGQFCVNALKMQRSDLTSRLRMTFLPLREFHLKKEVSRCVSPQSPGIDWDSCQQSLTSCCALEQA